MNAIAQPTPEEARAERQLRQCKRLAELGSELAEAAAALSKIDLAQQLEAQTNPDPDAAEEPQSPPRRADPGLLFVRFSRAVRQSIALENRIIQDAEAAQTAKPPGRPDERRATLQQSLGHATKGHADLQYGLHCRIDEKLDTDPDAHIPVETLLAQLIAQLGLPEDTPTTAPEPKRYVYNPPEPRREPPKPPRPAFILQPPRDPWPWEIPPEPPA